ncbi:heat shock factor protein 5 [Anarhichas minor]|uniref:heat shock factor protein 5 n=1 Tax=Anarhichas minor TaxID=65739 RepID=UPI003F7399B7
MDVGEDCLTESINSNNFPAKLWRLVNNPVNKAIWWDKDGLVVVINQSLVEQQVLSPRNSSSASDNADAFKTANFSSFVRNLNLYGFKTSDTYDDVQYRYYYHPNFKRNHPELVASLRRLTVVNKAKLEAGLEVNPRTPSRYHRYSGGCGSGDKDGQIGKCNHSLPSTPHPKWAHPYRPNKAPAVTAHNTTPVPPRFLPWGRGAALSPTVFATDKGIPVTLSQHHAGAASSSNAMLIQQSLLPCSNHGNQPGYYMPFCQCYHPNLVASQMAGGGLQKGSYPTHSHYQASCPVNVLSHVDRNQDSKNKEQNCDISLDTIFQIADEVMQTPANSSLVRVVAPVKPGPVSLPFPIKTNNPVSARKAKHLSSGPIVVSVRGRADLLAFKQQEGSVISPPEQMPEDAIVNVTNDDAKDTENIDVEAEDTRTPAGQAQEEHLRYY